MTCAQIWFWLSSAWMALARRDKAAPYSTPNFLLLAAAGISDLRSVLSYPLINHTGRPFVPAWHPRWHYHELGSPPARVVASRMLEQLPYVQMGDRLNISSEGARAIVKRNRLP